MTRPGDEWRGAAEGWRRWWAIFEPALEPVTSALVDLADLHSAQRVLDVATGFDEPALTAARWVGPPGPVVVADVGNQDLPDASFEAALCLFGLSFVSDLPRTLKRILALLVPGGRLAAAVWGPPARCPALSVPLTTMRQYVELPPVPPGAPGLFGLGGEGVIEDELNFAGFTDVHSRRLTLVFEWTSPEVFAHIHQAAADPIDGPTTQRGIDREETGEALLGATRARAEADGGVGREAEVVVVVGRRPARELAADL